MTLTWEASGTYDPHGTYTDFTSTGQDFDTNLLDHFKKEFTKKTKKGRCFYYTIIVHI